MKAVSSLLFVLGLLLALGQGMATQVEAAAPEWSQKLPAAIRFRLVLGNAAVLDKETNLVWEQSPGDTDGDGEPWWTPTTPAGIQTSPLATPFPMCSRPSTGRLLPSPAVPPTRGSWTSTLAAWASTLWPAPTSCGVSAVDMVDLMLSDLVI